MLLVINNQIFNTEYTDKFHISNTYLDKMRYELTIVENNTTHVFIRDLNIKKEYDIDNIQFNNLIFYNFDCLMSKDFDIVDIVDIRDVEKSITLELEKYKTKSNPVKKLFKELIEEFKASGVYKNFVYKKKGMTHEIALQHYFDLMMEKNKDIAAFCENYNIKRDHMYLIINRYNKQMYDFIIKDNPKYKIFDTMFKRNLTPKFFRQELNYLMDSNKNNNKKRLL